MMTIMEMLFVFAGILILSLVLGVLAVLIASASKRVWIRSDPVCSRCINGWKTRRGLVIRLFLIPLCMTLALFVGFTARDNYTVRKHIQLADHVTVRSGGLCHRQLDRERILFETTDSGVLEELSKSISFAFGLSGVHCRCCGDMTFDLYQDTHPFCSFTLHHGQSIRIKDFSRNDKELSAGSKRRLSNWLKSTGISAALSKAREEEARRDRLELQERSD